MAPTSITLEGRALHSGAHARVTIKSDERGLRLRGHPLEGWSAVRAERSTMIALQNGAAGPSADPIANAARTMAGESATHSRQSAPILRTRTVEHLFAALAGLRIYAGISIDIEGDELPLLDGTAEPWLDALATLSVAPSLPRARVVRAGAVDVARSRYVFTPDDHATSVSVTIDFDDARLTPNASWDGEMASFRQIASARTFCFSSEIEEISRAGLASHVTPESVVVIGETIFAAGRPFTPDEPARHKLLDLIGDLFLYGGPPRGRIEVSRPGHWSTHQALRQAIAEGLVAIESPCA